MEKLKIVELNYKKESNLLKNYNIPANSFSFLVAPSNEKKLVINDVTNSLGTGNYNINSEYTLLYLYELNDNESINFLNKYGGKLHNNSSANFTIMTYFTKEMIDKWNNVMNRDTIKECDNEINAIGIIRDLINEYNVDSLPTLIVIKKENIKDELSFKIDLLGCNAEELFNTFKDVMEVISDNCDEKFEVIKNKIKKTSIMNNNSNIQNIELSNYIGELIRKQANYNQEDLAEELNIDVRTLRNKRKNRTFSRDECIYIALRFGLNMQVLSKLLRINGRSELDYEDPRDLIICNALDECSKIGDMQERLYKIYELNDKLENEVNEPLKLKRQRSNKDE